MKRSFTALICLLGFPAALGCTARIDGSSGGLPSGPGGGGSTSSTSSSAPDTPIATPDAVALLKNPPAEPASASIACTDQEVVPRGRLWRLSASNYKNSVRDALGYADVDATLAPLDSVSDIKFSTSSTLNVVSQPWADWYFAQGDKIAAQLSGALPTTHACMIAAGASADCVQSFIKDYAGKLFRRPVTQDEITRYQTAYTTWAADPGMGPQDATWALLQAWTMSPNHVFRTELGDRQAGKVDLTQYEIASEISFMFADTSPDAALLADAQQGKLSDPAVVRGHAERLLNGPAGHAVLKEFFYDFLHLRELAGAALDPAQLPLVPSMQTETTSFVEDVIFNRAGGLDTLLTSTTSTIDQPLATFYGVSAGSKVDTKRPGLLHQAAFLNTRRDATRRGLFTAGELLCSPPSPPPPDAVAVASKLMFDENATGREIQQTIQNSGAVCKGCHATFAPMGLAFEHYDKLGKYREQQNGQNIDVTGSFLGEGDLSSMFTDSLDMLKQLVASNQGQLCFSKRFISYLEGRSAHGVLDGCLITRARTQMAQNKLSLLSLMLELTEDASFYKRINLAD
jgi:Protein of unknown function (DUF1592)/Protein of unknown function (DUF1588)/Protein of unknown function (DUF1595)/Protein of unknown function (DUF1587)